VWFQFFTLIYSIVVAVRMPSIHAARLRTYLLLMVTVQWTIVANSSRVDVDTSSGWVPAAAVHLAAVAVRERTWRYDEATLLELQWSGQALEADHALFTCPLVMWYCAPSLPQGPPFGVGSTSGGRNPDPHRQLSADHLLGLDRSWHCVHGRSW
jgi:hypothetical protein